MKSILISIKPEWVAKILNGEKTIEIRGDAPKCTLPIDVFIYCTKGSQTLVYEELPNTGFGGYEGYSLFNDKRNIPQYADCDFLNGKVVAKFRLEKIKAFGCSTYIPEDGIVLPHKVNLRQEYDPYIGIADAKKWGWEEPRLKEILKASCLTEKELALYISEKSELFGGFGAWFISDLEIFDEPKKLSDFGLKRAPQSWCYVGEDEMTKSKLMKYPKKYLVGLLTMEKDDAEFKNLMKKKKELIIENYIDVLSVLVEEDQLNV